MKPIINTKLCIACGICEAECPEELFEIIEDDDDQAVASIRDIKKDSCTSCGQCVENCPEDAIELKEEDAIEPKGKINEICYRQK